MTVVQKKSFEIHRTRCTCPMTSQLTRVACEGPAIGAVGHHVLQEHHGSLNNGAALLGCSSAFMEYLQITRSHGLRLPPTAQQRLIDCAVKFLRLHDAEQIPREPKMHMMVHLVFSAKDVENLRLTGTWVDEGLNMQLAEVSKSLSRLGVDGLDGCLRH